MKVLVTGGQGFVGGAIADAFRDRGDEVWTLSRQAGGASHIQANILDRLELPDVDAVVHAAAYAGFGLPRAQAALMHKVNVEGTRNVLDACADAGTRVLYVSSTAAIGHKPGGVPDESWAFERTTEPETAYAKSKHQAHLESFSRSDVDLVGLLPCMVIGLGDTSSGQLLRRYLARSLPTLTGTRKLGLVHVQDVADAALRIMDNGTGPYLAYEESASLEDMAQLFHDATGVKPGWNFPFGAYKALARPVESMAHLLGKTSNVSTDFVKSLSYDHEFDATRLRGLGWEPNLRAHLSKDATTWSQRQSSANTQ